MILQSLFSKQKVLLSANANHPIDEIESKFKELRENKYPIYIPYFRLGNIEKLAESIDYVRLCYRFLKSEDTSYQKSFQIDTFNSNDVMDLAKLRVIANSYLIKLESNKELYSIICYKDDDKENSTALLSAVKKLRQYLMRKENFDEFSKVFPIILSTCASANKLPLEFNLFDLVLLDESASCPLVSGLSPLIRGKRAVLCGDKKQLKAFTLIDQRINRGLMQRYNISNKYSYNELSLLDFIEYKVNPFPSTMLNEHYRCQKDIIEFCNRNFYESKMKIMTPKDDLDRHLFVYQIKNHTTNTNHSDEEAIFIINYIIDNHLDLTDIGIITPFVVQANNIKKHLKKYFPENFNDVSVGTVHSFQGDQKDVIFFSLGCHDKTSIRTLNSFVSKPSLVNVAISRAKKLFIAIGEFNLFEENYIYNVNYWLKLKNYAKALNTFSLVESNKVYESKSRAVTKKSGLSKAESEFYSTLHQILSVLKGKYKLETHTYLSEIIDDIKVKENFKNYHLDFLIRIEDTDKMIGIELDGEEHYLSKEKIQNDMKKDRLLLAYPHIKLLRFKNEERLLYTKVKDIIKDTIRSLLDIETNVL
ncbi:MAG TPA: hypothetical protein DCY93_01710 [Firmicutes bacterium]|nr:hypothetical protein [Bacillota bacterium]